MIAYRARLAQIEAGLGPRPSEADRWRSQHSHEWFTLEWNARRQAVLDRDIDAIIATHARDRRVAAWLQDTAEAFDEIRQGDLVIDWAQQATDFNDSLAAREEQHRPLEFGGHLPDDVDRLCLQRAQMAQFVLPGGGGPPSSDHWS